jgi:cell wall-associated NlpC family hydrolase
MAVDPATLKVIAKVATTALSDEKGRRAILIAGLIPFIIVLLVLSSPFAIFFALLGGHDEQISVVSALYEMKEDFQYNIQLEESDETADVINTIVMGSEDGTLIDNSEDVLIAYAVKYNVTEENSEQMAVLSDDQVENLRQVYNDMNIVTVTMETTSEDVVVETLDEEGNTITSTVTIETVTKTINVDCLTAEEIGVIYGFDETQTLMIAEMRRSGYGVLLARGNVKTFLTRAEIDEIKSHIPEGLELDGEQFATVAKSIVGQVSYFWGGKSSAIGWDSRWGTDMEVTSAGSSTTGTMRPFGLDCSGFVTWVFYNMGLPLETIEHGVTAQWNHSTSIPESIVEPGDLAILAVPYTRKVNHIGIVVGKDEEGKILVAHCTAGANNIVITTAESTGFVHFRRPAVLMD